MESVNEQQVVSGDHQYCVDAGVGVETKPTLVICARLAWERGVVQDQSALHVDGSTLRRAVAGCIVHSLAAGDGDVAACSFVVV